jgi:hypothetical protein
MNVAAISGLNSYSLSAIASAVSRTKAVTPSSATGSATSAPDTAPAAAAAASDATFYSSPILAVDSITGALVQEYRDTKTGAELYQSPSQVSLLYGQAQTRGSGSASSGSGVSFLS